MDFFTKHIIIPFWKTRFGQILHQLIDWCKITYYIYFLKPKIEKRIAKQDKLSIVFFVINVSMWKADSIVKELLSNSHYDIHIVSFLYPQFTIERRKEMQKQMEEFFTKKNYPYINSYDFSTNTYFDIRTLHPDIIFYNQPYNLGYSGYQLQHFWKTSLFAYIPYCLNIEKNDVFYDTLYINVCKYVFLPTQLDLSLVQSKTKTKAYNCKVVGNLFYDELKKAQHSDHNVWKDNTRKHIIWAPHHSILPNDELQYSTFLRYANYMLYLADKYKDVVEFAFKPHPALKDKLYQSPDWGYERTNQYYTKWANMSNTFIADGSYANLFAQSDAMIHDCSTFSCEYLYTNKPVLFLLKETNNTPLTELGASCLNMHYHAYQEKEIEEFINNVISGIDVLKKQRHYFVEHNLTKSDDTSTTSNIIQELNNLFISQ